MIETDCAPSGARSLSVGEESYSHPPLFPLQSTAGVL